MRASRATSTLTRPAHVALLAVALAGCGSEEWQLDGGDQTALGREYVAARGCATCHQGDEGTLAGQREARPGTSAWGANLTPDIETGLGAWADIQIVRAMRYGVDHDGLPLCPPMPRFNGSDGGAESFMTDLEAGAIVAYLRSLPPVTTPGGPHESICPPLKEPRADLAPEPEDAGAGP